MIERLNLIVYNYYYISLHVIMFNDNFIVFIS